MHSAQTFISLLLAASTALAGPLERRQEANSRDTEVRVILSGASELAVTTTFDAVEGREQQPPRGGSGPWDGFEVSVGADAQQNLRCQALDLDGKPLVANRGQNTDKTFSDADKGRWNFVKPVEISQIVCDPTFVAVAPGASQVRVTLAGPSELATQTIFYNVSERMAKRVRVQGPYDTVDILVGELVDPKLRCQVIDRRGRVTTATRGANTDVTFSDGGPDKNEWTFDRATKVSHIICDPEFVGRN